MPKRTNEFQKLVALVERALAPKGARVTESALIPAGRHGKCREIDVLIETEVGPYEMKIAIEAKNEGRKMDLTKFESILGKYRSRSGIRVDRVVIVSREGFTPEVVDAAEQERITLLTLQRALDLDWSTTVPSTMIFSVEPHVAGFEFSTIDSPENIRAIARNGNFVCTCCGKKYGNPTELAGVVLRNRQFTDDLRAAASRTSSSVCTKVQWQFPPKIVLQAGNMTYPVHEFKAHFHCAYARGELSAAAFRRGEQIVRHLSGDIGAKHIQLIIPDGAAGHQVSLRIDQAKSKDHEAAAPFKSAEIPPVFPPKSYAPLLELLDARLRTVDAAMECNATVHDFATGSDRRVPLLVTGQLGGPSRFRTAILFPDNNAADVDAVAKARKLCFGAHLDRIVMMRRNRWTSAARTAARRADVVLLQARQPLSAYRKLVQSLGPPVVLFCHWIAEMELRLMASEKPNLRGSVDGAHVELTPRKKIPISALHTFFGDRLREAALREIVGFNPTSRNAEIHFDIAVPLRQGASLSIPGGQLIPVAWIVGTATIRAAVTILDRFAIEPHAGMPMFKFSTTGARPPTARTGDLPRRDQWSFANLPVAKAAERITQQLNLNYVRDFSELIPRVAAGACASVMSVRLNPGSCPVCLQVHTLDGLRRLALATERRIWHSGTRLAP